MKNMLHFELLMPSNTELLEIPSVDASVECREKRLTRIKPLKKIDGHSPVGCFLPSIVLEENSTYELFLSGLLNPPSKENVSLTLGDRKLERIQDVTGEIINCFWRFKTLHIPSHSPKTTTNLFIVSGQTLYLSTSECYLRQISDHFPECLFRGGSRERDGDRMRILFPIMPEPLSLLHSLFEIYVLNFNHEPHKWIECKKRMKVVGLFGNRLGMSLDDELPLYKSWKSKVSAVGGGGGSSSKDQMDIESWCMTRQIISTLEKLISSGGGGGGRGRVLFLSADSIFHPKFETILYNSLSSKPFIPKLLSLCSLEFKEEKMSFPATISTTTTSSSPSPSTLAMGISSEFYRMFISKFESSPVSIERIFSDCDGGVKHIVDCITSTSTSSLLVGNSRTMKKHYITILVRVPRRSFAAASDSGSSGGSKLTIFLQCLQRQNYPYWNCILLTEEAIGDSIIPLEGRIVVVERKYATIGGQTFTNILGPVIPSKYFILPLTLASASTLADTSCLSRHIYGQGQEIGAGQCITTISATNRDVVMMTLSPTMMTLSLDKMLAMLATTTTIPTTHSIGSSSSSSSTIPTSKILFV